MAGIKQGRYEAESLASGAWLVMLHLLVIRAASHSARRV